MSRGCFWPLTLHNSQHWSLNWLTRPRDDPDHLHRSSRDNFSVKVKQTFIFDKNICRHRQNARQNKFFCLKFILTNKYYSNDKCINLNRVNINRIWFFIHTIHSCCCFHCNSHCNSYCYKTWRDTDTDKYTGWFLDNHQHHWRGMGSEPDQQAAGRG